MNKLRSKKHVAILFSLLFLVYGFLPAGYQDLPRGATDGSWVERAIAENNRLLSDCTHNLQGAVVRAEVVGKRVESFSFGDTVSTNHLYSLHEIKVLEVHRGNVGENLVVIQLYQLENIMRFRRWVDNIHWITPGEFRLVRNIPVPLSIGDELILFLQGDVYSCRERNPNLPESRVRVVVNNPIQGAYRYTPQDIRGDCENWIFESINPHNNLTLTVADLQQIRDAWELDSVKNSQ